MHVNIITFFEVEYYRWRRTTVCSTLFVYVGLECSRSFLCVYSLAVSEKYFERRNRSAPIRWAYVTAIFVRIVFRNSPLCMVELKVEFRFRRSLYRFIQPLCLMAARGEGSGEHHCQIYESFPKWYKN